MYGAACELNLDENSRILEIGCGEGDTLARIAEHCGCECIGIDKSKELIRKAREKHASRDLRLKFTDAPANKNGAHTNTDAPAHENEAPAIPALRESASSFDAIIMECVLSVSGDSEATFGEYATALKTGGHALISDLCERDGRPDELIENARKNGLRLISLRDHTADLDSFAIQKIMEYGSLENYFNATVPKGANRCDFFPASTRPPGYFLAIFQRLP
ncbi:MAG: class I SAM-dependent methyltransferase [Clostridiales Family XIII bacterium]|nr:class I SAM-dependent methyltransferase [Clostridiales Family XIII bacterium]